MSRKRFYYALLLQRLRPTNVWTKLVLRDGSSAVEGPSVESLLAPKPKISSANFLGLNNPSEREDTPDELFVRGRFRLSFSLEAISNRGPVDTKCSF